VLMRLPKLNAFDDGPGKPVGIDKRIGSRPIAAFGNSDGDMQMLQYQWMHEESYDERAVAWHRHQISQLKAQLAELEKETGL
jgi:hypothetical protein